nr:MAG TPA: hypothetical protein [Caudoviricetes sp.]
MKKLSIYRQSAAKGLRIILIITIKVQRLACRVS